MTAWCRWLTACLCAAGWRGGAPHLGGFFRKRLLQTRNDDALYHVSYQAAKTPRSRLFYVHGMYTALLLEPPASSGPPLPGDTEPDAPCFVPPVNCSSKSCADLKVNAAPGAGHGSTSSALEGTWVRSSPRQQYRAGWIPTAVMASHSVCVPALRYPQYRSQRWPSTDPHVKQRTGGADIYLSWKNE